MSRALALAAERGELTLAYQPVLALEDGRVNGFEALLRWTHEGQRIAPAEFIPLAERTGAIVAIGDWVLTRATRQLARWQAVRPDARVAVNLSPRQIATPGFVGTAVSALDASDVDPHGLAFEITETAMLADHDEAVEVLGALRGLGCRLMLDDFGIGYSSLERVARVAVDALKIDRGFVERCEDDPAALAVVDAVVGLAAGLDCDVIAEGIETPGQRRAVQAAGCRYGQGFLFARALPARAAQDLLAGVAHGRGARAGRRRLPGDVREA